jgi:hypothetical protein
MMDKNLRTFWNKGFCLALNKIGKEHIGSFWQQLMTRLDTNSNSELDVGKPLWISNPKSSRQSFQKAQD